ncbi:hypothetical protein ASPVEDRAFT_48778 [Aspergillus versicolor CBS 583.65]|uniref:Pyridoxamine 5'-phosphate oxidase putative domain-containing protein n=1 Tax=Aspergillus versicolor CBS 583.65 TaxID=1036611 RepID=A0A1L9P546_ASPVE|nr:uncharacterized protein ASPVEDRAFT_48778 [Aspergillus versicolor CBS 583.65]OJI96628.1 hypothetical protein ASPVEDRAFT_48778 [Aspergillus versicolor CBS 583.65]
MPKFYPSISPDLRDWALSQKVFFTASAPLSGRHINLSPKGLPDASFAILGPNEAAYVDATGSGGETISHLRENGRITILFCSFDASPRILRFFCTGSVIEWSDPNFESYLARMQREKLVGARAIIRLDVFKVQTSCGYGVPQLSLSFDSETNEPKPDFKDRETLGNWASKRVEAGDIRAYQGEWNSRSLDGLPGLRTALQDKGQSVILANFGNWTRYHRDEIEFVKTSALLLFVAMAILQWAGYLSASGSASDRRHAIAEFARNYPQDPVDVIIADFMSEANMVVAAGRRVDQAQTQGKPSTNSTDIPPGYELSFLLALQPALEDLAKHRIKLAVNAGNTDTQGLYDAVTQMIRARGLDLKVAWVSGDEVLSTVRTALSSGKSNFKNIYTNEVLSDWSFEPIFAQCYLGGLGIAAALAEGADIVLCGRVSDASPVIGAAYWYHQWRRSDLDQLANAFVAGHLIECSNYVCGGNYTGFKELEHLGKDGWSNIGYPIAEISAEGKVIITMQSYAAGGTVTVDTCSSQLLYEIQGPWYFNSDVTAILNDVHFEQVGTTRVALHGVRSAPPPPTTKVGITARGGFQAEASWFLVGLDIDAKARMLEAQIRHLLAPYSSKYTSLMFSTLGSAPDNPKGQNSATVTFRVIVQARTAEDIAPNRFLRHITDNIMQGYPGATFHLDLRQGFPKPIFEYYVALLPQEDIQHRVHLPFKENKVLDIPAPPRTATYPLRQPSQALTTAPIPNPDFGPTTPGPLGWLIHARSGDKGPDANCGFWVRHSDEYAWLRSLLSTEKIRELLGPEYNSNAELAIERFELPNLRGVHFLFRNLLDRGVSSTTTVDFLGKNVAEFLRARWVDLPVRFLNRGRL